MSAEKGEKDAMGEKAERGEKGKMGLRHDQHMAATTYLLPISQEPVFQTSSAKLGRQTCGAHGSLYTLVSTPRPIYVQRC